MNHSIKSVISKLYVDEYTYKSNILTSVASSVINYQDYENFRNNTKIVLKKSTTLHSRLTVVTIPQLYRELGYLNSNSNKNPLPNDRILSKYLVPRLCSEFGLKLYDLTNTRTKKVHQLLVLD